MIVRFSDFYQVGTNQRKMEQVKTIGKGLQKSVQWTRTPTGRPQMRLRAVLGRGEELTRKEPWSRIALNEFLALLMTIFIFNMFET